MRELEEQKIAEVERRREEEARRRQEVARQREEELPGSSFKGRAGHQERKWQKCYQWYRQEKKRRKDPTSLNGWALWSLVICKALSWHSCDGASPATHKYSPIGA